MAQRHALEPRNATRKTPFCNPVPFPLVFLEELRIASDTIACNALALLCGLLAFAFLLVLYAYLYLEIGRE